MTEIRKNCSEVFVADHGCNLFSLDLRNGQIAYGYKGIAGAVTSVAPIRKLLASVGQDRSIRLHSTFPPPKQPGQQQEHKGEVLDKTYMKVVPTVVVADPRDDVADEAEEEEREGNEPDDDDVWEEMEDAESDTEGKASKGNKKCKSG